MIDILIQSLLLGGLYCLFALGLSLMYGVMRVTNIAHGDFLMLFAFLTISVSGALSLHPALAGLLLLPVAFVIGYLLQSWFLNRTIGRDPLPSLVLTFGFSFVIQNLLLELYSADPRMAQTGSLGTSSIELGGDVTIGLLPLVVFAAALLCTGGLQLLFNHTRIGRAFRAVSDDRDIAELMGMDANRIYALATAIAFVVIAIGGSLQAMRTTVSPSDGPLLLIFAFESVIIGGMGSFWGTLIGAMVLGFTQQIGFTFAPVWGLWFGHIAFLAMLLVRPQGLFPKTRG